jgi:hypothetical protein
LAGPGGRTNGYELKAQLLGPLDKPHKASLVGHLAGKYRGARTPLHSHPVKQAAEMITQLAAQDYLVPIITSRLVTVHHYLPYGWIPSPRPRLTPRPAARHHLPS